MSKPHSDSIANAIRNYATAWRVFTAEDIKTDLGFSMPEVNASINYLVTEGWLTRTDQACYEYKERHHQGARVVDKIWRACRINPTFTYSDIARQTDTSPAYARKRIKKLEEEGFVEAHGRKKIDKQIFERVFRLSEKGREMKDRPGTEFISDIKIRLASRLYKMFVTGMIAKQTHARAALKICTELKDALEILIDAQQQPN